GACFTLEPDHPNAFAAQKRPAHTLTPVLMHDGRGLAAVAGTRGDYKQPQINAQTLLHMLRGGTPSDPVAAPRWVIGRPEPNSPEHVVVEGDVPDAARGAIEAEGFQVRLVGGLSDDVGHAHLIRARPGRFDVGSAPRADGGADAG